jgi:hypothetical protein
MALFLTYESPNLIELKMLARQIAELGVHELLAPLTDANAKPHDCVAVNACDTLYGPNAGAFRQQADYRRLLVHA